MITALTGWEGTLPALRRLHLRRNKISTFEDEMQELPELEYINLRRNSLDNIEQVAKIFQFPKLVDLNIINNPVDNNCSSFNLLMAEFLTRRPALTRFCKVYVTERHSLEAVHLAKFRWEKSEAERKAKEAAEAAAAEAEEH